MADRGSSLVSRERLLLLHGVRRLLPVVERAARLRRARAIVHSRLDRPSVRSRGRVTDLRCRIGCRCAGAAAGASFRWRLRLPRRRESVTPPRALRKRGEAVDVSAVSVQLLPDERADCGRRLLLMPIGESGRRRADRADYRTVGFAHRVAGSARRAPPPAALRRADRRRPDVRVRAPPVELTETRHTESGRSRPMCAAVHTPGDDG